MNGFPDTHMHTLHLTADEAKQFAQRPAELRRQTKVLPEESQDYETDAEIDVRIGMAQFARDPVFRDTVRRAFAGGREEAAALRSMPIEVMGEFFFTIGAKGMSRLVDALVSHATDAEDLEALAYFTAMRRKLLEINGSVRLSPVQR